MYVIYYVHFTFVTQSLHCDIFIKAGPTWQNMVQDQKLKKMIFRVGNASWLKSVMSHVCRLMYFKAVSMDGSTCLLWTMPLAMNLHFAKREYAQARNEIVRKAPVRTERDSLWGRQPCVASVDLFLQPKGYINGDDADTVHWRRFNPP